MLNSNVFLGQKISFLLGKFRPKSQNWNLEHRLTQIRWNRWSSSFVLFLTVKVVYFLPWYVTFAKWNRGNNLRLDLKNAKCLLYISNYKRHLKQLIWLIANIYQYKVDNINLPDSIFLFLIKTRCSCSTFLV